MASVGIRELKDTLSQVIRRVEAGERVAITAHGRVVAELVPPATAGSGPPLSRFDQLLAEGRIRPPLEPGPCVDRAARLKLPRGTLTDLLQEDRGE